MIKQSSKRLLSMLVALGFVVVALVVLFDLVQPEYQNFSTLKGQVVADQAFYQSASAAITQAQKIIGEYQGQGAAEQSVNLAIPANQDIAGAIAQIYGIASANSLTIQTIGVSAPILQTQNPTQTVSPTSIVKPLGSISLQVTAAGSYESLQNFLAGIEGNVRIFDLKGIFIQPASGAVVGKAAAPGSLDFFNYTMAITTYYQTN